MVKAQAEQLEQELITITYHQLLVVAEDQVVLMDHHQAVAVPVVHMEEVQVDHTHQLLDQVVLEVQYASFGHRSFIPIHTHNKSII